MQIETILKKEGPMLSGSLAQYLVKSASISTSNAKQMISRAPVEKLRLGFENNQSFVFLAEHKDTGIYWKTLVKAMQKHAKAYYSFITALKFHHGFMKRTQIPAYTIAPCLDLKGHAKAHDIMSELLNSKILVERSDNIIQLSDRIIDVMNFDRFKAIELAKEQIISNFTNWARNLNLISYHTGMGLDDIPVYGPFQWGFTSPSYVNGIGYYKGREMEPGFVVADILIGREVQLQHVDFFLRKIDILKRQKNLKPFLPILICNSVETEAFKVLKKNNILIGFIKELFGSEYQKALELLIEILTNATKVLTKDPDKFIQLLKRVPLLDGKFGNLKGDLFEFAVGYYYVLENNPIVIGKKVKVQKTGMSKEIDVFVNANRSIHIVECKGHNSQIKSDVVKEWLNKKVPVIREWILSQDDYKQKKLIFEMWSISGFDSRASRLLTEAANEIKKYDIKFYDRDNILLKAKESKNQKFREVIQNYF